MPYITQAEKAEVPLFGPRTVGQLTYELTTSALKFKHHQGQLKFVTIALVMGAFFCAALEFYRRVAVDYETQKMWDNGDVYNG
jgi:hypothetical protein